MKRLTEESADLVRELITVLRDVQASSFVLKMRSYHSAAEFPCDTRKYNKCETAACVVGWGATYNVGNAKIYHTYNEYSDIFVQVYDTDTCKTNSSMGLWEWAFSGEWHNSITNAIWRLEYMLTNVEDILTSVASKAEYMLDNCPDEYLGFVGDDLRAVMENHLIYHSNFDTLKLDTI